MWSLDFEPQVQYRLKNPIPELTIPFNRQQTLSFYLTGFDSSVDLQGTTQALSPLCHINTGINYTSDQEPVSQSLWLGSSS
jgi:hypothetical protein